jgi:hypothetical protein
MKQSAAAGRDVWKKEKKTAFVLISAMRAMKSRFDASSVKVIKL